MRKELTVDDLPADVVEKMREMINGDSRMEELRRKRAFLLREHCYMEAQKLKQMIDGIEIKVINGFLAEYKGQAESMENLMRDMTEEDRDEINVLTNCVIFLCDMVETFTMDCDAVLRKYHPDYRIEMFDRIAECGKAAREQVEFMSRNTGMAYQTVFADDADKITELVRNKARSLVRKLKRTELKKHNDANGNDRKKEEQENQKE